MSEEKLANVSEQEQSDHAKYIIYLGGYSNDAFVKVHVSLEHV